MLFAACYDGAIHIWNANSNFVRPHLSVEGAHAKGVEICSMVFSVDGRTVLTRGMDDTVKCEHRRVFRVVVLLTMRSVGHSGFQEAHSDEERRDDTVPSNERDL